MKKKMMLKAINNTVDCLWNLLDSVSDKIENIETKIDLLKNENISFNSQKLMDLIADTDENKKEIMEIKSMISNLSNQIAAKETKEEVKEEPKPETPAEEKKETAPTKKAPTKKSTTKKAPAKK